MNAKKAKLLRKFAKQNMPADLPDALYTMTNPLAKRVQTMDGKKKILHTGTMVLADGCKRSVNKQVKLMYKNKIKGNYHG